MPRFRSSFAAPTGFVAAVTRVKPSASGEVAWPVAATRPSPNPLKPVADVVRQAA